MRIPVVTLLVLALTAGQSPAQQRAKNTDIHGTMMDVDISGSLYVVDGDKNTVTLYSADGKRMREIGGQGWENDQFDHPGGIWARNGIDVFIADYGNHRIQRYDRSLNFVATLSTHDSGNPDERFGYPTDVAVSRLGDLFICDSENTRVVKVDRFSQVERTFGGFDAGKGRLQSPSQLEIGPRDCVYVLDGSRILVFDAFGNFLHEFGTGLFKEPRTLYADADRIAVADAEMIYCFDANERPVASTSLQSVTGPEHQELHATALSKEKLYLLVSGGLVSSPNPCSGGGRENLDKQ